MIAYICLTVPRSPFPLLFSEAIWEEPNKSAFRENRGLSAGMSCSRRARPAAPGIVEKSMRTDVLWSLPLPFLVSAPIA